MLKIIKNAIKYKYCHLRHKDDENKNNSFTADDFPVFEVGANEISWTGTVERIEIQPNWRWL